MFLGRMFCFLLINRCVDTNKMASVMEVQLVSVCIQIKFIMVYSLLLSVNCAV